VDELRTSYILTFDELTGRSTMDNQPISKLQYDILATCIVEEPFSIVIASAFLDEGYELGEIISSIMRLVGQGYLAEVNQRKVSEYALLEYVEKRMAAGEDVWKEWPGVVEEYNFLATKEGCLQLREEDRPTPLSE
jgi:hypothetical protein